MNGKSAILQLGTDHSRCRLACLPSAGGGVAQFSGWRRQLASHIELLAASPPGRDRRREEPAATDLVELAAEIGQAIVALSPLPLALFGHSLGGWVAFELAHYLCDKGYRPVQLFVSACPAPQLPDQLPRLSQLNDQDFLAEIQARYKGIEEPLASDPEFIKLILPILRADVEMRESYVYRARRPLACPLTALGGESDHTVSPTALAAWQTQTQNTFSCQTFAGGHFFLRPSQGPVLHLIEQQLAGILAG